MVKIKNLYMAKQQSLFCAFSTSQAERKCLIHLKYSIGKHCIGNFMNIFRMRGRGTSKIYKVMVSLSNTSKRFTFLHGHMSFWKQFIAGTLCFELLVWNGKTLPRHASANHFTAMNSKLRRDDSKECVSEKSGLFRACLC